MANDIVGRARVLMEMILDDKSLDKTQKRARKGMDRLRKATVPAAAGLAAITAAGTNAALSAEQLVSEQAKLSNVLGNMGKEGAADRLADLADEKERQIGVDEKTILSAQALLATFSEVASSADDVGGVMDRATDAALDLEAAGFGGAEDAAKQLGKALQDPVKGISALREAGVTFTDKQKEMIEALVDTGKVGKAQDIILGELEKQVGGTALATADSSEKMRLAFADLQERIGEKLLPVFEKFAEFVLDLMDKVEGHEDIILGVAAAIGTMAAAVIGINAATKAWTAVTKAQIAVQKVLNFVLKNNPIGRVIVVVAALTAAVIAGYKNSERFRSVVDTTWKAVKAIISSVWNTVLRPIFSGFINLVAGIIDTLGTLVGKAADAADFLGLDGLAGQMRKAADAMDAGAEKARKVAREIGRIPKNKTVTVRVNTRDPNNVLGFGPGATPERNADGGVIDGLSWVGERGPELISAPGSRVYSAPNSRSISQTFNMNTSAVDPRAIAAALDARMRAAI